MTTKKPATNAPKAKKLTDAERLDRVESTLQALGHIPADEKETEDNKEQE